MADAAAHEAHVIRERSLRQREEDGEGSGEQGGEVEIACDRCVAADDREAAPRKPEPEVRVEASFEELEVVGEHQEEPDGNECHEPRLEPDRAYHSDRARACDGDRGESYEDGAGDSRPQGPPAQLVECVRAHADGEPECEHDGPEPPQATTGARHPPMTT